MGKRKIDQRKGIMTIIIMRMINLTVRRSTMGRRKVLDLKNIITMIPGGPREAKMGRKKKEGDADEKDAAKDSTDSRFETDTSIDQDCGGKNEKVIEKADQECMEKPANNNQETAEKASVNQHAKPTEGENSCSSLVKPVEIDDSKADVKSVARQSMPADDDITPITSVPTVITLDNDQ